MATIDFVSSAFTSFPMFYDLFVIPMDSLLNIVADDIKKQHTGVSPGFTFATSVTLEKPSNILYLGFLISEFVGEVGQREKES